MANASKLIVPTMYGVQSFESVSNELIGSLAINSLDTINKTRLHKNTIKNFFFIITFFIRLELVNSRMICVEEVQEIYHSVVY